MEDVSLLSLLGRLAVSLGVVLLLMVLLARVLRRRMVPSGARGARGGRPGRPIEVVARQGLGRNASVAVVRVGARQLVLGVTETNINILAEADDEDDEDVGADWTPLSPGMPTGVTPSPTWRDMVERLRERTVRRS